MIITDINAQKRKGRYNIFVDGGFFSGLDAETIVKSGLKAGLEIDKDKLEELVEESETRSAFEKLINLISRQMYSKKELETKLIKYGYSQSVIKGAILKAEEYGYINDELYAKLLVEAKPLKSKTEIKNALFLKGINSNTISEQTKDIDKDEETSRAIKIAEKYMKNKEVNEKNIANLYNYLARRGFLFDAINRVLSVYKYDDFIEE